VLDSGVISAPGLDLIFPSIAVNSHDRVVIGFTGSGANQFASSYAVAGETIAGKDRVRESPAAGAGRARIWTQDNGRFGDYSATVLDPQDPNWFWTFQEYVSPLNEWAVQITQLVVQRIAGRPETGSATDCTAHTEPFCSTTFDPKRVSVLRESRP
jgi:hypothetical protein